MILKLENYFLNIILIYAFYNRYQYLSSLQNNKKLEWITIPMIKSMVMEFPKVLTSKFKVIRNWFCLVIKNNIF